MGFLNSLEFNLGGRFVAGLYVGLLDRNAEFGGWQFQRDAKGRGDISPQACASVIRTTRNSYGCCTATSCGVRRLRRK
jgi:hypothetical protein